MLFYSISYHMDFNTAGLFCRPPKSWSTYQLHCSIARAYIHQQYHL